ncbi:MAG: ferritin-like domain-containing protein [Nitrospinaceae bacterium]
MEYGTEEHKNLFCRFFIDTHQPFRPEELAWPDLKEETIQKLADFPIWDYAVHTESQVFHKLKAYSEEITDPLLKKAMALQGYEERRHADILKYFLNRYNIPFKEIPDNPLPGNLEWGFLRTGAGECIDSFFAFGFLEISKSTGDYPLELIRVMEPIVQEEARHILFIQNWILYMRQTRPFLLQPLHYLSTMWAFWAAAWSRLMDLKNMGGSAFTIQARKHEKSGMSPKDFINLCLRENNRRLMGYDPRLARPKLVPRLMSMVSFGL